MKLSPHLFSPKNILSAREIKGNRSVRKQIEVIKDAYKKMPELKKRKSQKITYQGFSVPTDRVPGTIHFAYKGTRYVKFNDGQLIEEDS